MKKHKVNLKKLSLQKRTIASVNADSVQGGTGYTHLETRIVLICQTTINTTQTQVQTLSCEKTKCITDLECPSDPGGPCPGTIIIIDKTEYCQI